MKEERERPLIIFDFDGTLADTWECLADELVNSAGKLNYAPVTRTELEGLRSLSTKEVFEKLEIPWWRVPRVAAHLRKRAEARVGEMRLFAGIPDLLRSLHGRGLGLAVVSSNSEGVVRQVLGPELSQLFDFFDCSTSVFGKAAKFKRIIRKCGAKVAHVTAVGDETRDIEAAGAAGIRAVTVEWGYTNPAVLRREAPGRTAGSMDDLFRMLVTETDDETGERDGERPPQASEMRKSGSSFS